MAGLSGTEARPTRRFRYGVAMSLDGYIAGPNGESDWIVHDPDIDFNEIFSRFYILLIGRKTFEAMLKPEKSTRLREVGDCRIGVRRGTRLRFRRRLVAPLCSRPWDSLRSASRLHCPTLRSSNHDSRKLSRSDLRTFRFGFFIRPDETGSGTLEVLK
ncbi:MAG: hypothetical protein DMF84_13940 [Acidobacteria bacterium]|nr:MAG: hypothetical protein DMF84_13940 [Acidobacteriota bacterium]